MTIAAMRSTAARDIETCVPDPINRIAFIDAHGNIVAVNEAWMALAEETGTAPDLVGPGVNYFQVCRAGGALGDAREALKGIRAVLTGKLQSFSMDYSCLTPSGRAHFRMGVTPIHWQDARVVISHTDITALQHSKEQNVRRLRHLIRRLVNAQEEERQRIAREIHDDLGNRIALLAFSVRRIMNDRSKSGVRMRELGQLIDGITDLSRAMRNLTHCLHPPLLKHSGICAALQGLCEEFGKTQGIQIDVVVPTEPPAIPDEVGLCIFRISQECLQNIAKHSGADNVSVVLERTPDELRLKVSDTGRGFDQSEAVQKGGLGLISMRERVLCIRGQLEVNSAPGFGTKICVTIPLPDESDETMEYRPSLRA